MERSVFEEFPQFVQQNEDASGLSVLYQLRVTLDDPVNHVSIGETRTALYGPFDHVDHRRTGTARVLFIHDAHNSAEYGPPHWFAGPGNEDRNVTRLRSDAKCLVSKALSDKTLQAPGIAREPMRDQQCEAGLAGTIVARKTPRAFRSPSSQTQRQLT